MEIRKEFIERAQKIQESEYFKNIKNNAFLLKLSLVTYFKCIYSLIILKYLIFNKAINYI